MKKKFESRYNKDEQFYSELLANATIILDTNVLLSLYRFSEPTRNYFIDILLEIKDRLWLPYQVGNEFFANRLRVICEQIKSYTDFEKEIDSIKETLDNKRSHPFLSEDILKMLKSSFDKVNSDLANSKQKYEKLSHDDIILHKILELYDGKVGQAYSLNMVDELIKTAIDRYSKKIPPGYTDFKPKGGEKPDNTLNDYEKIKPYGDYFLWKQSIDYAKDKTDIILVTDDIKEDWYSRAMGKTIGPRHELLSEFKNQTNKDIYIYQSDVFIKRIGGSLGKKVNDSAIEEIKESYININHTDKKINTQNFNINHTQWNNKEIQDLRSKTYDFLYKYERFKEKNNSSIVDRYKKDPESNSHLLLRTRHHVYLLSEHINKLQSAVKYFPDPRLDKYISNLTEFRDLLEKQIDAMLN